MSAKIESRLLRITSSTILVLFSLYVLSFGPVVASIHTTEGTPPEYVAPLERYYAPLIWIMDRSPTIQRIAIEYVTSCGSPFYNSEEANIPDPPKWWGF